MHYIILTEVQYQLALFNIIAHDKLLVRVYNKGRRIAYTCRLQFEDSKWNDAQENINYDTSYET